MKKQFLAEMLMAFAVIGGSGAVCRGSASATDERARRQPIAVHPPGRL